MRFSPAVVVVVIVAVLLALSPPAAPASGAQARAADDAREPAPAKAPGSGSRPGPAAAARPAGRLTPAALDQSLALGRQYLLNAQRPNGSFVYEIDAVRGQELPDRNIVREMGALWGVALFHRHAPAPGTSTAFARAMRLQDTFAKRTRAGGRYLCEPASREGTTNAMALYAMALQDFLAADHALDAATRAKYERDLAATVKFLLSLRLPGGRFYPAYNCRDGRGVGEPESYSDGEALLALARAAAESDDPALRQAVLESAGAMYVHYVRTAIQVDPANEETKGFYQWGSLAFYQIYTAGWPGTAAYAPRTIALARWMIDVHGVLARTRNTGYAYEGLAVAWELARLTNDRKNQQHIGDTIHAGLSKLLTWQVGSPFAGPAVPETFGASPRTKGGILSEPDDPRLRVDTVQHQMHASLLVRRLMFRPDEPAEKRPGPAAADGR